MAQFDVLRPKNASQFPLVVDVQADIHAKLVTRLVVPLAQRSRYAQPLTRLTPLVKVRNVEYVVLVPQLAAYPAAALGEVAGSLAQQRAILIAALDFLIVGS
jgi:toxin CcdB